MYVVKTTGYETCTIQNALPFFYGNITATADHLGINRGTLRSKINSKREYLVRVLRDEVGDVSGFEAINK